MTNESIPRPDDDPQRIEADIEELMATPTEALDAQPDTVEGGPLPDDEASLLAAAIQKDVSSSSEVTDEDLSASDLMANGAMPEDLEQDDIGYSALQADLVEPAQQDTIDDRVRQEISEEGTDIVPEPERDSL